MSFGWQVNDRSSGEPIGLTFLHTSREDSTFITPMLRLTGSSLGFGLALILRLLFGMTVMKTRDRATKLRYSGSRRNPVAHRIGVVITIIVAICVLSFNGRGAAAPSPMAPDALLEQQWHLKDRSLEVGGANVRDAWPISVGSGVVIGIVDDGLQW